MYQSLYRKYRPKTITDVVGQKIAVKIIKNALNEDKVNHAYMFSGPRGTGKTTMAKILAKSINCLNKKEGIACETCKNCLEINSGSAVDIIEIDAASNNGVDEIREIRNNVTLSCSSLKYKVYIIDEVHMLTIGAFNALLKTLEEPPEHIIFILATTDIQKVPATIISRCQCINFESISEIDIKDRLKYITEQEHRNLGDDVLLRLSEISNGGLRDAIGNLEKLLAASTEETITINNFNEIFGFADNILLEQFFETMINAQVNQMLKISNDLYNSGKNFILFINELIEFIRKKIQEYYQNSNGACELCDLIFKLNKLCNDLKNTDNIKALFEAGIINIIMRLYHNNAKTSITEIQKKDNSHIQEDKYQIEEKKEIRITAPKEESPVSTEKEKDDTQEKVIIENNEIIKNNAFAFANKKDLIELKEKWHRLNDYLLDTEIGSIACYLVDGNIRVCGSNYLIISYEYDSMVERGLSMYVDLKKVLNRVLDAQYDIALLTDEQWSKEKEIYIYNIKNNINYESKPLKEIKNNEDDDFTDVSELDQATLLFGKDIVEIK